MTSLWQNLEQTKVVNENIKKPIGKIEASDTKK